MLPVIVRAKPRRDAADRRRFDLREASYALVVPSGKRDHKLCFRPPCRIITGIILHVQGDGVDRAVA